AALYWSAVGRCAANRDLAARRASAVPVQRRHLVAASVRAAALEPPLRRVAAPMAVTGCPPRRAGSTVASSSALAAVAMAARHGLGNRVAGTQVPCPQLPAHLQAGVAEDRQKSTRTVPKQAAPQTARLALATRLKKRDAPSSSGFCPAGVDSPDAGRARLTRGIRRWKGAAAILTLYRARARE